MYEESATISLIAKTAALDADGIPRKTEGTPRVIFAKVRSATAREVFEGGRSGLDPAYTFVVLRAEYRGETLAEYRGERFSIYRTFVTGKDRIELHAERRGGAAKETP